MTNKFTEENKIKFVQNGSIPDCGIYLQEGEVMTKERMNELGKSIQDFLSQAIEEARKEEREEIIKTILDLPFVCMDYEDAREEIIKLLSE